VKDGLANNLLNSPVADRRPFTKGVVSTTGHNSGEVVGRHGAGKARRVHTLKSAIIITTGRVSRRLKYRRREGGVLIYSCYKRPAEVRVHLPKTKVEVVSTVGDTLYKG
jgi:hypothetical protein